MKAILHIKLFLYILTLQAYLANQWQDIAHLQFDEQYQLRTATYLNDYSLAHYLQDNWQAFSLNYPVELFSY